MAKRKTDNLVIRNKFYIITKGEQTESNYFSLLKHKHSIYEVKIKFENKDPLGLVQFAVDNYQDANQKWCVFDIDNTFEDNRLKPAIKLAAENNIKIAYSNMAFEVWLISHFEKCSRYLTTKDFKKILDRHLKSINKELEYSKSDEKLLKDHFIPNYKQAVENAKIVHQQWVKENQEQHKYFNEQPIWKWNSSTTVYKLIEALKLQK